MRLERDTLLRLIRQHFAPELQKHVTFTRWKDGIDVEYPIYAIEAFAEGVCAEMLSEIIKLDSRNVQ